MVAVGASGLQVAAALDFTSEGAKPWSVSATLRGFYDDNISGIPSSVTLPPGEHKDSFGFSVSPGATLQWQTEQTTLSAGYVLSALWYENRPISETSNWDLDHTFNLKLDHTFNERYRANVTESFVVGQEPDMLRAGNAFSSFQRIPGSNIRNYGSVTVDATITPVMALEVGYANAFYDYADTGFDANAGPTGTPSIAGVLNRIEQTFHLDARWQWRPETTLIAGYQFSEVDYTGNEEIGANTSPIGPPFFMSNSRNDLSQYFYLGVDHTFRPELTASLRGGGRYNDYYNDSTTSQNGISPYLMASARYAYMTESSVEAGVSYDRSSTELFSVNQASGSITTDAQDAALWVSWNHRITPKVYGSLMAQLQNSTYDGGSLNNDSDMYYILGLTLEYRFTPNFSTQLGYNYDHLVASEATLGADSVAPPSFVRNRVYIGVTASY